MTTTPPPVMDLDKALRLFRTLPADQYPGRLAECATLVLAELGRLREEVAARDELLRRAGDVDLCLCLDCVAYKLQQIREGE